MQTDMGHYHDSTLKLLQQVRKEEPTPAAEQPRHGQEEASPHVAQEDTPKTQPTEIPHSKKAHEL